MKVYSAFLSILAAHVARGLAAPASRSEKHLVARQESPPAPSCTTIQIPVSVEQNTATTLSDEGEDYSINVLYALMDRKILRTASYNLSAIYCEPTGTSYKNTSGETVQLLIHGATYSKVMWDFPYQPEKYSWVRHAAARGYATLAVDQVGAGNSTFGNGLLEVQTQTYVETLHQVIEKLRSGSIAETGNKAFFKVVPIGFSLGAVTLISLADQYPEDGDAIVLHGVSWSSDNLYPAFFAGFQVAAAQLDPDKWGWIPTSYTTQSTPRAREITCFYGNYDKGILDLDYKLRDFDTLGASITIPYHTVTARDYTGPVFLGNGNEDATFCGQFCGVDPYEVYPNFPNAVDHVVKIYPETGHVIHLHNTITNLIEDTHEFLQKWNI